MTTSIRRLAVQSSMITLALAASIGVAHAQAAPSKDSAANEIVVTGSLIKRPNYVSSSPIVSTSAEAIQQTGAVSLEGALDQLPEFTPAGTAANGGQGTGGHVTLNLHGLGANRNLVLLDGRRLPASDITGDVDINLIPESIIAGVDTISGGASAVYGSEAMSGVVNFKTIKQFEGVIADVQYGNSFRGDYQSHSESLSLGTKFADDKGHMLVSLSYTDRDGLAGSARSFFNFVTPSSYIGQGTFVPSANNLPSQAAVTGVFTTYGVTSAVARTLNLGFNDDGTLFTQTGAKNYKGPTSGGYAIIGGNVRMPVGPQTIIENPLTRKSIFSKFDYALTPGITAYGQILYVDSDVYTSSGKSLTQLNSLTTIPVTNPFIPADLLTILNSRPNPTANFLWNGRYVGLPNKAWDEHYTTSQFLGGFKGELPLQGWSFDAYVSYDSTDHVQSNYNAVLKSQVQTLLSAPDGGKSLCTGGFDPFGLINSGNISASCQAYMTTTAHSTEHMSQAETQLNLQGPVFKLPAGEVTVALQGEYRRNTYNYQPDPNLRAGNIEAVIASAPSQGAIGVKEFAAQIDVPILRDAPLANSLNLGGAVRYSDYTSTGGVTSYEADLKWRPVSNLLIRGAYERAVRAPNIAELYSAPSGSQVAIGTPPAAIGDPCDVRSSARTGAGGAQVQALCLAQGVPASVISTYTFPTTATGGTSTGNPNLHPETADTFNVGIAYTSHASSPWLSSFSASIDYYNIHIKDVISVIPGLTTLSKCFNLDGSNPTYSQSNYFCSLIQRDANGQLTNITTPYLNLGGLKTNGVDIQLNWSGVLADLGLKGVPGKIGLSSGIGYTHSYEIATLPGSAYVQYVGTNTIGAPYPVWKAVTTLSYGLGGGSLGLRWRYLDGMKDVSAVLTPNAVQRGVPAYNLFDLVGTYKINQKWALRAGITNLFNNGLPIVASSQTSTDPSTYDAVGRSFYLGVHAAF